MKNIIKKRIIKIVVFILIIFNLLSYVNKILKPKYPDGIYSLNKFYEQKKNTIDVLVLGSSHAFESINTGMLWDEYGIASYDLGGAMQPIWNTYYYLKEALKYQKPKLIILEGFGLSFNLEYGDEQVMLKNTIGFKNSKEKNENIKISVPENRWEDYFIENLLYHTRYKELDRDDFYFNKNYRYYDNWKGFGYNFKTEKFERPPVEIVKDDKELNKKNEKYYRAILRLAKDKNIPIIVILAPYSYIDEDIQGRYNKSSTIAKEYDVPFIDGNKISKNIGIDYATDMADALHLNHRGNEKFTKYIGDYIKENYNIPYRKGDTDYISWERNARYIEREFNNQKIRESEDINEIINLTKDDYYDLYVSIDGNANTDDKEIKNICKILGIKENNAKGIWYIRNAKTIWYSGKNASKKGYFNIVDDITLDRHKIDRGKAEIEDGYDYYENDVIINKNKENKAKNGLNIVIYDNITETLVGSIALDKAEKYDFSR